VLELCSLRERLGKRRLKGHEHEPSLQTVWHRSVVHADEVVEREEEREYEVTVWGRLKYHLNNYKINCVDGPIQGFNVMPASEAIVWIILLLGFDQSVRVWPKEFVRSQFSGF
jgi:hypothetical protein